MRRLGEIALISDYLAPLATGPASFGLKDDAALLTALPASGLVVTTDASVAGVHFFEDDDPGDAAYKALAVNVSDLAAKAASPLAYTLTLALADAPTDDWAKRFTDGLARGQAAFGLGLIGGDTVTAKGAWWMSITAFGEASHRGLVPRGGGQAGDYLYVSGTLGDSAFGLRLRLDKAAFAPPLQAAHRDFLLARYLFPEPRLALSDSLARFASAAMDISDGLVLDLTRMCSASQVSAEVSVSSIPLSEAAKAVVAGADGMIHWALSGGDDYEILAAVPPALAPEFEATATASGVRVTRVGALTPGSEAPRFMNHDGTVLQPLAKGFEHFLI
jgi:thiamine-monophosphate kinase